MRPERTVSMSLRWRHALVGSALLIAGCGGGNGDTADPLDADIAQDDPTDTTTMAVTESTVSAAEGGSGAGAAMFVCDTIRVLRADFAGIEDDLTSGGWVNGFVAALGNVPDEATYGEIVDGRADAPSAALCPDDWAEYLTRAEITTLQGIDVLTAPTD